MLFLGSGVGAVRAQDTNTLRTGVSDMVSVLTLGAVSIPPAQPQVIQVGNQLRIDFPLSGLSAPPDAVAQAIAQPDANGAWTVTALSFPAEGAIGPGIDQSVSYTIGRQAIHGRLDPTMATPSEMTADLGAITLQSLVDGHEDEQTLERLALEGKLAPASGGHVNVLGRDTALNWHTKTGDRGNDSGFRRLDGHFALTGLDQEQAEKALRAARSLSAMPLTRAKHEGLRTLLDTANGLLTHVEVDETADGVKFDLGQGSAGSLGRVQLHLNGGAENHLVNGSADIAADDTTLTSVSSALAGFMPRHVTTHSVLASLPAEPLMALLRAATAPSANQSVLLRQAAALLNAPNARAAIESIDFDSGPLHIRGSAKFLTRPNGEAGADIHLVASGMGALMTDVQGNRQLHGMLPFLLIAQGLGRPRGDGIVWDIAIGGVPLTINGTGFGQLLGNTR